MRGQLLAALQARANVRGLALAEDKALLQELQTSREELDRMLDQLEREQAVEVLAPLPFLVLRLRKWSGRRENAANSAPFAYSYSKLSNNRLKDSYRAASHNELMREILDTLGETDPTTFEGAIANFPVDVIRKALDRVRRARSVRKNRTALFRYLLTKLSKP